MNNQTTNDYSTLLSGAVRTSFFHQAITLITRATFIFAILWIVLLSTSFWFKLNVEYLGIPAVILSLVITHFLLIGMESNFVSNLFSFVRKGKPIIVYRHWSQLEANTIKFGAYRLLWKVIDGVSLSYSGNLIFTSTVLSGPPTASKVLRMPFAVIDLPTQKRFVSLLKEKCPQAKIAPSLATIADKIVLPSTDYIHLFTALVFLLIFFDVGYSTFRYVELLKRYYLCDQAAVAGDIQKGQIQYEAAEQLRMHVPPFSIISKQLFSTNQSLATIQTARSKALWDLGQKEEALLAQELAAILMPKSYKIVLCRARLSLALGKIDQAKNAIEGLIDQHKHALLPRLYLAFLLKQNNEADEAKIGWQEYLSRLDKEYFSSPPVWPASGEESLHELFYRDDLHFLFTHK